MREKIIYDPLYGDNILLDDDGNEIEQYEPLNDINYSEKGGKGSGFFGHVGILGHRGGSAPVGSGIRNVTGKPKSKLSSKIERNTTEKLLSKGKMGVSPTSGYYKGVTASVVCHVEGDGNAIVKGTDGNFSSAENEEMTYQISKAMGFDIVPITVLRKVEQDITGENRPGTTTVFRQGTNVSVQEWVEHTRTGEEVNNDGLLQSPIQDISQKRQFTEMGVLDVIIGNLDRHDNNYLISPNGKLYAVDNGAANMSDNIKLIFEKGARDAYNRVAHISLPFARLQSGAIPDDLCDTIRTKCSVGGDVYKIYEKTYGSVSRMQKRVSRMLCKYGDGIGI